MLPDSSRRVPIVDLSAKSFSLYLFNTVCAALHNEERDLSLGLNIIQRSQKKRSILSFEIIVLNKVCLQKQNTSIDVFHRIKKQKTCISWQILSLVVSHVNFT